MKVATGDVLEGRYRVLGLLGEGTVGVVYEVEHIHLGRRCALKLLLPHWVEVSGVADRFVREAKLASRIEGPFVAQPFDFGFLGKQPFIVMERLHGWTFRAWLSEETPSAPFIIERMLEVLAGLEAAHEQGITHRDLKPENLFVVTKEQGGFCKILDLGIAKVAEPTDDVKTTAGVVFGTPRYMAPEQAAGEEVDSRADLYSMGVILFEALSGKAPFQAQSAHEILRKQIVEPAPDFRLKPDLGGVNEPRLRKVLASCLEKDPEQRPQSAAELRELLRETVLDPQPLKVELRASDELGLQPGGPGWWISIGVMALGLILLMVRPSQPTVESVPELEDVLAPAPEPEPSPEPKGRPPPKDAPSVQRSFDIQGVKAVLQGSTEGEHSALIEQVNIWLEGRAAARLGPVLSACAEVLHHKGEGRETAIRILLALVDRGTSFRMRRLAYEALESAGLERRTRPKTHLLRELRRNKTDRCEIRRWYVRRLAELDDPSLRPALLQERNRKGGFLNLEPRGACLRDIVDQALKRMEDD